MYTRWIWSVLLIVAVVCSALPSYSAETLKASDVHLQLAKRHLEAGHPFWAIHSYRRALESGGDNPNTHRQLSQVLYDLGFVDQAISEMELALKNAASEDFLHMEMGVFCLAAGQMQRALREFTRVMELNAGFSYGYYYLGEVYYRLADYDHAAAALVLAQHLGLPGFELERKLNDLGWQLPQQPWPNDNTYCLRQITLNNKIDADEVQQRLQDGELFEELARQFSTAPEAVNGGYVGTMSLANMPKNIAQQLANVAIFSAPQLLHTEDKYIIVQRIAPFASAWWQQKNGLRAQAEALAAQAQIRPVAEHKPYLLLSGVYHNRDYAIERVEQLHTIGINSTIQQRGSGSHLRYEVIAGRFAEYTAAETVGGKIVAAGLDYYIRNETK
ncbi:MAG: peptidylprolyl isomerase [Desulfuromonas sp.]|nr:peptidylprolyl isomerase [Desulfuromonas sp.]